MAEYLFAREIAGDRYNVNNLQRRDMSGFQVPFAKDLELALPGKVFDVKMDGAQVKIITEEDWTAPEQATAASVLATHKTVPTGNTNPNQRVCTFFGGAQEAISLSILGTQDVGAIVLDPNQEAMMKNVEASALFWRIKGEYQASSTGSQLHLLEESTTLHTENMDSAGSWTKFTFDVTDPLTSGLQRYLLRAQNTNLLNVFQLRYVHVSLIAQK